MVEKKKAEEIKRAFEQLGIKVEPYPYGNGWVVDIEPSEEIIQKIGDDYKGWERPLGFRFVYDGKDLTFSVMVWDEQKKAWDVVMTWWEGEEESIDPVKRAEGLIKLLREEMLKKKFRGEG
jgi:hypothetical protein